MNFTEEKLQRVLAREKREKEAYQSKNNIAGVEDCDVMINLIMKVMPHKPPQTDPWICPECNTTYSGAYRPILLCPTCGAYVQAARNREENTQ